MLGELLVGARLGLSLFAFELRAIASSRSPSYGSSAAALLRELCCWNGLVGPSVRRVSVLAFWLGGPCWRRC